MATAPVEPRIDERAMSAGTTVRFALLMALLLVASGSWMLSVSTGLSGSGSWAARSPPVSTPTAAPIWPPPSASSFSGRPTTRAWPAFNDCRRDG